MKIRAMKIENIKCFSQGNAFLEELSDINIFIGRNNSGKSTILTVLDLLFGVPVDNTYLENLQPQYFTHGGDSEREPRVILDVQFSYDEASAIFPFKINTEYKVSNRRTNGNDILEQLTKVIFTLEFDIILRSANKAQVEAIRNFELKEPRIFHSIFDTIMGDFIENQISKEFEENKIRLLNILHNNHLKYIPAYRTIKKEKKTGVDKGLSYKPGGDGMTGLFWGHLNLADYDRKLINKEIKSVLNDIFKESSIGAFFTKEDTLANIRIFIERLDELEIPLSNLGDGVINLLLIITNIVINRGILSFLCIDEPENNLHPLLQRKFYKFLKKLATDEDLQIFLSTHSTYFLDVQDLKSVHRMTLEDGRAKSYQCSAQLLSENKDLIRMVNVKSAEFFFADKIILVEGLSDKMVLSHFAKELDYKLEDDNILFLEVGGREEFRKYKRLLEAFGIDTYIIADLDFLVKGLGRFLKDHDDSNLIREIKHLRDELQRELAGDVRHRMDLLKGSDYQELKLELYSNKEKFMKFKEPYVKIARGETPTKEDIKILEHIYELEELKKKEKAIKFNRSRSKDELIKKLVELNIFILQKGELEDYYPEIKGRTKTSKALKVVDSYNDSRIKEAGKLETPLEVNGKINFNEFELIFDGITS